MDHVEWHEIKDEQQTLAYTVTVFVDPRNAHYHSGPQASLRLSDLPSQRNRDDGNSASRDESALGLHSPSEGTT
jgi:hypothetical protein